MGTSVYADVCVGERGKVSVVNVVKVCMYVCKGSHKDEYASKE